MTWRTVSVEVDMAAWSTRELIDELRCRGVISEGEKGSLRARKERVDPGSPTNAFAEEDREKVIADQRDRLIDEAAWRLQRRELADGLHCIARAFPQLAALQTLVPQA